MAGIAQGAVIAEKYRLERRLSHGGMGSVWLGHHLHLDAPVAIKFMRPSLVEDAGARARFEREAKAAAQIRSPHVVHVYDHGIDDDVPFIVMEYLEGQDLRDRLRGKRRLPPAEAVRICSEVCKGLHRAHGLGIVHRDLKPGNIWLSEPDDDLVKLVDFGIAKETGKTRVVRGETTTTGQLLGSPHYMSPEQARGQPLDGRSDLWSLAVILFRALTGRRPFDGDDIGDLIVRICMDPIPPVTQLVPSLGQSADRFFEIAFDRDPGARFQSAREFAGAFASALAEATLATSDEAAYAPQAAARGPSDEALTPSSPGSSRFGNMVGPMDGAAPAAKGGVGDDTFAATTSPTPARRRLLGGAAALGVAGVAAIAMLVSSREEPAPARIPQPVRPEVVVEATPAAAPPAATSTASISLSPATSTSASAAPPRRPAPVAPPPRPAPAPAPAPAAKPKPKNPFGY